MTTYELIKQRLTDFIWFRERTNKNFGIAKLLIRQYNLDGKIDPKTLEDMLAEHATLDRTWRKVLQENPHLRGQDYDEKVILEQKKVLELGYEIGASIDNKQKTLI
jgi:hypothetical protein